MGCDIHAIVEQQADDGRWVTVNTLSHFVARRRKDGERDWCFPAALERNHRRFAALAGVHGDGPVPRGVPADVSETGGFRIATWNGDAHSHSWLTIAEAAKVFAGTEYWSGEEANLQSFPQMFPACFFFGVECEDIDKHRLVFWFTG